MRLVSVKPGAEILVRKKGLVFQESSDVFLKHRIGKSQNRDDCLSTNLYADTIKIRG